MIPPVIVHAADGVNDTFTVPFPYLHRSHVRVTLDDVLQVNPTDFTWATAGSIQFASVPSAGGVVRFERVTPTDPLVNYTPSAALTLEDLQTDALQSLYRLEELENVAGDLVLRGDLASGASDKGSSLIKYLAAGSGAVPRWLLDKLGERITPEDYGAVGDGITNDATALQAAATAAFNKKLTLTPGKNYKIGSAITITQPIEIYGYGSKITTTGHMTGLDITSGDVKVLGVEIEGAGNASYDNAGRLISIKGVDGGAAVAPTFIANVLVRDCKLHDAGRTAMYVQYVEKSEIDNCDIWDIGYAGIEHVSCRDVNTHHCSVKNVGPGSFDTMYGMYMSQVNSADMVRHPCCARVTLAHNTITDVVWEGLDCHGGTDLAFLYNTINNCGDTNCALVMGYGDDEASTPIWPAENIRVIGNNIINCNDLGIATSDAMGVLMHKNITISGNTLYNVGSVAVTSSRAGVRIGSATNVAITGNTFHFCAPYGVAINATTASNISVMGNSFRRIVSNALSAPACIRVNRGATGTGPIHISGNTLELAGTGETYEAVYGVRVDPTDGGNISIGANHFNAAGTKYGVTAAQVNNGSSFPVTNSGIQTIAVSTGVNTASATINLPNVHSGTTLYTPWAAISSVTTGNERTLVHVVRVSPSQITITVYTANGSNFPSGGNINVNWQTGGY